MELKDRALLVSWLEEQTPIEKISNIGSLNAPQTETISEKARRAYELIWSWSAPRYIGAAGAAQDRFFERCGRDALERRINRARWLAARLNAS